MKRTGRYNSRPRCSVWFTDESGNSIIVLACQCRSVKAGAVCFDTQEKGGPLVRRRGVKGGQTLTTGDETGVRLA